MSIAADRVVRPVTERVVEPAKQKILTAAGKVQPHIPPVVQQAATKTARTVNSGVKGYPWTTLIAVAIATLLLGRRMGRTRRTDA
jgi:hypothetical protein